jgi:hypothetical protein
VFASQPGLKGKMNLLTALCKQRRFCVHLAKRYGHKCPLYGQNIIFAKGNGHFCPAEPPITWNFGEYGL